WREYELRLCNRRSSPHRSPTPSPAVRRAAPTASFTVPPGARSTVQPAALLTPQRPGPFSDARAPALSSRRLYICIPRLESPGCQLTPPAIQFVTTPTRHPSVALHALQVFDVLSPMMSTPFRRKGIYLVITHSVHDLGARRLESSYAKVTTIHENDKFWLGRLDHKDWLAPNEVLKVFRGLKNSDLVLDAYRKLASRKDYKPNEALYSLLIDKLVSAKKFGIIEGILERIKFEKCRVSDDFFYKVIKIYGNVANHPEQAIKTLFKMPEFHCWPKVRTFNFVLNMLVCSKQFDVIHDVYLHAPRLGVTLDTCCFNILIKGLCNCGKIDSAFLLLDEIPKQGCKPNVKTYSTLMYSLCKNHRVKEAFDLYERMEANGCYPDTVTFNILISGLCRQGKVAEGMEFLKKMKLKGCHPNSGTYQALLHGFLRSEQFVKAKELLDLMLSEGCCPSILSFKLLIEGFCQENLLSDAESVLKQMVHQGFVPRVGTWKKLLECLFSRIEGCGSFTNIFQCLEWRQT
ncbi:hypothetical protein Taro_023027, partial [Colocasia esculenta]|nr:hypothetical protein [Colocasia esculenta]